jgi:hypothetical protein
VSRKILVGFIDFVAIEEFGFDAEVKGWERGLGLFDNGDDDFDLITVGELRWESFGDDDRLILDVASHGVVSSDLRLILFWHDRCRSVIGPLFDDVGVSRSFEHRPEGVDRLSNWAIFWLLVEPLG